MSSMSIERPSPPCCPMQRLCCLLSNLRSTLLEKLYCTWPRVWDLSCESCLVDVGSGYGKARSKSPYPTLPNPCQVPIHGPSNSNVNTCAGQAVMHFALEARLRRSVGIECVISRHEIAEQSLIDVKEGLLMDPSLSRLESQPSLPAASSNSSSDGAKGCNSVGACKGGPPLSNDAEDHHRGGSEGVKAQGKGDGMKTEAVRGEGGAGITGGSVAGEEETAHAPQGQDRCEQKGLSSVTNGLQGNEAAAEPPVDCPLSSNSPTHSEPVSAVNFHFGDATRGARLDFSHVYTFDRVFSPTTQVCENKEGASDRPRR